MAHSPAQVSLSLGQARLGAVYHAGGFVRSLPRVGTLPLLQRLPRPLVLHARLPESGLVVSSDLLRRPADEVDTPGLGTQRYLMAPAHRGRRRRPLMRNAAIVGPVASDQLLPPAPAAAGLAMRNVAISGPVAADQLLPPAPAAAGLAMSGRGRTQNGTP